MVEQIITAHIVAGERMAVIMEESVYCRRCHRKLKDENSRKLGFGKVCYKKYNDKRKTYLFDIEVVNSEIKIERM